MTNRERLIKLLQYLYVNTDDEHSIGTSELTEHILGENTQAKRKTIKADIEALEKMDEIDIICEKGSPDRYNWGNRLFDIAEIKFLIDCVSSSGIITNTMSEKLIGKLQSLVSCYQLPKLESHLYIPTQLKSNNLQVFYTVDLLNDAINSEKKVSFQYWKYGANKEKQYLADGERMIISPYGMAADKGRYYVVGWSELTKEIVTCRIDKIHNLNIEQEMIIAAPEDFKMDEFLNGAFRMYAEKHTQVTLECSYDKMNTIIDHFGIDTIIVPVDDRLFRVNVAVKAVDTFYGWVFQAQGGIKIVSPESVKEEYKRRIRSEMDSV